MLKKLLTITVLAAALAPAVFAQNTNSTTTAPSRPTTTTTTRQRTTTTTTTNTNTSTPPAAQQNETPRATPTPATTTTTTARSPRSSRTATTTTGAQAAGQAAVRAAFDALIDGITRSDVDAVMNIYWNSPQLVVFNNNGTVTKSWAQVRANRESLYARLKDVKIAVRDVRVQMIGADNAVVSYLWTQSQVADGTPESATGRSTLVFRRVGVAWKVVHAHTSPDAPDPSRLLPSERIETPVTPTPAKP